LRLVVLTVATVFIVTMTTLTGLDFADNGVTPLGVVAVLILLVCGIGILGALVQPPRK
jgi:hypothetical protein